MEKAAIDLKGLIFKKNGEYFSLDEFFKELETVGYIFAGGYDYFEENKMNMAIEEIKQGLNKKTIQNMFNYLKDKHNEENLEDIECFLSNTDTGIFEDFIKNNLSQ